MVIQLKKIHEDIFIYLESLIENNETLKHLNLIKPNVNHTIKLPKLLVQINDGTLEPMALGGKYFRLTGILSLEVIIDANRGEGLALSFIDELNAGISRKTLNNIEFRDMQQDNRYMTEKEYQVNISFQFIVNVFK